MINLYIVDIKDCRASSYGIGTYINELSFTLNKDSINVNVINLYSNKPKVLQSVENGITYLNIPKPKLKINNNLNNYYIYNQSVIYILKEYIQSQDNLVFHLNYFDSRVLSTMLKETFNCKIILTMHCLSWSFELLGNVTRLSKIIHQPKNLEYNNPLSKKIIESFNEEKRFFHSADKILCLSKHTSNIVQEIYKVQKQKITTVYNGLDDKWQNNYNRISIRKKYNLPIDGSVIIFAGRLDQSKGISYFINASKILVEQIPNCHVIIAGNGAYDTYIKECGNRWMNIHFIGFLEKAELYELYSIADFGVMPSLHEQCSYTAIEMMMHGLPIIASTSTGLREMVVEGITGLHVPVVEYEDKVDINVSLLAEKMLYMLTNENERNRMGKNARKRYLKFYSSKTMGENMNNFYKKLLI